MSRQGHVRARSDGMRVYTCERCGEKYIIVKTEAGAWQRLAPRPSMDVGTVVLSDRYPGCPPRDRVARTLTHAELSQGGLRWRYTDHRAVCARPYPAPAVPAVS